MLLIYPPVSFKEKSPLSAYCPPLGLLYLGTVLKAQGHEVQIVDAEAERLSLGQIIRRVRSAQPEVVGLTCLTFTLETCKSIVQEVRRVSDAYIAVGGPHVMAAPQQAFEDLKPDVCVVGEAESTIGKIVEEKPRGVVYSSEIREVDQIPFPDRSLLEHVRYGSFYGMKIKENMTGILTSRGCKYGCSYCNRPKKLYFRARSPRNVVEELKQISKLGFESVWIADDNFTNHPENVIKLSRLIKRERLKLEFYGEARVDVPSEALFRSMKEMGVVALGFGVESLNQEVIRWYNKTPHPQRWASNVKKTLELCKRYGIIFLGSLIFGAPMETKEDMMNSINFLERNGADLINGNILLYLIGSPIWHWAVREGKIKPNQYMVSAPEAGLTPYTHRELQAMCDVCTDFCKRDGWGRIFQKMLQRRRFGLILAGALEFVKNYGLVKKIRRAVYGYGYGKKYTIGYR